MAKLTALKDHPALSCTKIVVKATNHSHEICELDQLEDGFWYAHFYEGSHTSVWDSWLLREIADHIDQLNRPWLELLNSTLPPSIDSDELSTVL